MGCDIHSVAQVFRDGRWVTVLTGVAEDPHAYGMFGLLAGVRDPNVPPIAKPRGLPDDFAMQDEMHPQTIGVPRDGDDRPCGTYFWMGYFGYSWYTLDELLPHAEPESWLEAVCESLTRVSVKHGVPTTQVRYVFGFDN